MALISSTPVPVDLLAMSDDDFLNMGVPPEPAEAPAGEAAAPAAAPAAQAAVEDEPLVEGEQPPEVEGEAAPAQAGDQTAQAGAANPLEQPDDQLGMVPPKEGAAASAAAAAAAADPAKNPAAQAPGSSEAAPLAPAPAGGEGTPAAEAGTETPPDYKALYEKIMAPFQANGKKIDLRNPEEAITLMQMGANYTRKLQELAPHRKVLTMLQNNGLLDEGKLSFLIDLEKKNPEAIKKLVKDAGLDPMDIDTSVEPAYREGNHRVTDAEVNFRSALDELSSNPAGQETLRDINTRWDQASKEALWSQPEMMAVIHSQRESGIYSRIVEEMDRQRTLGQLRPDLPFLHAYQAVGTQLQEAGKLAVPGQAATAPDPAAAPAPAPAQPAPVAVRAAVPKPQLANGEQAAAASPSRSSSRKAQETVNPLSMSDEDFLKLTPFKNRL